jgi:hypothetical protein
MTLRNISPKIQTGYIATIKNFTRFLSRSPDSTMGKDLRRFQLHVSVDRRLGCHTQCNGCNIEVFLPNNTGPQ